MAALIDGNEISGVIRQELKQAVISMQESIGSSYSLPKLAYMHKNDFKY